MYSKKPLRILHETNWTNVPSLQTVTVKGEIQIFNLILQVVSILIDSAREILNSSFLAKSRYLRYFIRKPRQRAHTDLPAASKVSTHLTVPDITEHSSSQKDFTMLSVATKEEFDSIIAETKTLIVVDFFATWCGPCRAIAPELEKWSKEFEGEVLFLKIDVDENEDAAEEADISAMPSFHFYKNGEKIDEVVGANKDVIESKIRALK
ncbi:hypothetical protein RRG08_029433 [Elysia crispata]|uniref:Thioredoxin domain-containing protein n=1 Tax=Elysia crispata TaxID=231223 RepID=A0AAE1BD06_9GAST|nr:hypothetical protein RRG08_029433 [Elysia crispata]